MQNYFSYIDTALRVIHINRNSPLSTEETEQLNIFFERVENSTHMRQQLVRTQIAQLFQRDSNIEALLIHEFHHYLQGLFYPFLFYVNWLEFDNLNQVRTLIKNNNESSFKLDHIGLNGPFKANFVYLSQKFELYWTDNNGIYVKSFSDESLSNTIFSLNDLLEDCTTVFQYKVSFPDNTAEDFHKYVLNPANKCYRRLYKFLVSRFTKEFVFDLLPIFVQVAFTTTEPIGAFCNIVSFANLNFRDYKLYSSEFLLDFFLKKLESVLGEYEIDPYNDTYVHDLPNKVLRHNGITKLIDFALQQDEFLHYPFAYHAKKFHNLQLRNPNLLTELVDINRGKFENLLKTFEPMAIHFHFNEMKGRNGTLVISNDYSSTPGPLGSDYGPYIKEIIKLKEIVQGLITKVQDIVPPNCHHVTCPYYSLMICRKYNSIPSNFDTCGFPDLFQTIFHRKINLLTKTIDKITKHEADERWHFYIKKSFKKRHFNYFERENIYVITIGKGDFEQEEKRHMFKNFLDYLIEKKGETEASLCGRIELDFYGFDDDPREINVIPETTRWIKETFSAVPYFLCYINFDSAINHFEFILPCIIKHKMIINKNDELTICLFDEIEKKQFVLAQTESFLTFCKNNPKAPTDKLYRLLTKFYGI